MHTEIIEIIRSLNKENASIPIDSNTELVESGILDSFALITLMTEIENKYQIEITDEYFEIDYFKDVNSIVATIKTVKGI